MGYRYSASLERRDSPASGGAYAEMLAEASKSICVRAIRITTLSNLGGEVALARAYAIGTGAATGIATGVAHRLASTPTTSARLQAAWSSSGITPTALGSRLHSTMLATATGTTYELWREEDGPLVLEPSTSLLVVNQSSGVATAAGLRINVTWEVGPLSDR